LTTHYDEIEKYKDNPEKILTDRKDDIAVHIPEDLDSSTAEKVMAAQTLLGEMSEDELIDYFNSKAFANEKLPYIKEFVTKTLEYQHRKAIQNMIREKCKKIDTMSLDELVKYFESEEFDKDKEEHEIKEHTYERLRKKFSDMKGNTLLEYYDKK
jgi:hypothetical protein